MDKCISYFSVKIKSLALFGLIILTACGGSSDSGSSQSVYDIDNYSFPEVSSDDLSGTWLVVGSESYYYSYYPDLAHVGAVPGDGIHMDRVFRETVNIQVVDSSTIKIVGCNHISGFWNSYSGTTYISSSGWFGWGGRTMRIIDNTRMEGQFTHPDMDIRQSTQTWIKISNNVTEGLDLVRLPADFYGQSIGSIYGDDVIVDTPLTYGVRELGDPLSDYQILLFSEERFASNGYRRAEEFSYNADRLRMCGQIVDLETCDQVTGDQCVKGYMWAMSVDTNIVENGVVKDTGKVNDWGGPNQGMMSMDADVRVRHIGLYGLEFVTNLQTRDIQVNVNGGFNLVE